MMRRIMAQRLASAMTGVDAAPNLEVGAAILARRAGRRRARQWTVRRTSGCLQAVSPRLARAYLQTGAATSILIDPPGRCSAVLIDAEVAPDDVGLHADGAALCWLAAPVALVGADTRAHVEPATRLGDALAGLPAGARLAAPETLPLGQHAMVAVRSLTELPAHVGLALFAALGRGEDPIGRELTLAELSALGRSRPAWERSAAVRAARVADRGRLLCAGERAPEPQPRAGAARPGEHRSTRWRARQLWLGFQKALRKWIDEASEVPSGSISNLVPPRPRAAGRLSEGWRRWLAGIRTPELELARAPP